MNTIPEETYIVVKQSDLMAVGGGDGDTLLIVRRGATLGSLDIGNVADAVEVVEDFKALGQTAIDYYMLTHLAEECSQCPMCGQKKPEATGRESEN